MTGEEQTIEPALLADSFQHWLLERTRFLDKHWSPIMVLHRDFCSSGGACDYCRLEAFTALLDEAGLYLETTSSGCAWCHGVVLLKYLTRAQVEKYRPQQVAEKARANLG